MINKKYLTILMLLIATIFIASITLAVYYPVLSYDFVWDDLYYLPKNPHIEKLSWQNIQWMFTTLYMSNWHPLTWLSFAADYAWQGGLHPWGFHLTNVILHNLNSISFFFLSILLLNINCYGLQAAVLCPRNQYIFIAAFIAALLFGIHPQHIESVAWISERKDVLCLFFLILTIFSYIFYTQKSTLKWYWFLAALLFFILALMSKPMAVTLPAILLLLDIYPLRRTSLLQPLNTLDITISWGQIIKEKIPFFALTAFAIFLTLQAQAGAIISIKRFDMPYRIINAIHSIFVYISKFLLPIALSPLYTFPDYLAKRQDLFRLSILIAGFFLISVLSIYFWIKKKKYYLLIIWLFYLVTLFPMIGIIQVGGQASADRYAYLPTLPFYILAGCGIAYLFHYMSNYRFAIIAKVSLILSVAIICLILFNLNRAQLHIWKHDFIFWHYAIKFDPANSLAQHNLAAHYFNFQDYEKALERAKLAVLYGLPWQQEQGFLGEIFIRLDRLDEALSTYQNSLRVDSSNVRKDCVRYNISWIYAKKGLFTEARKMLNQIPMDSPEFLQAQTLIIQIAMFDALPIAKSFELEKIEMLLTAFDRKELEQAKLDDLLAKQGFSLCFKQIKHTL